MPKRPKAKTLTFQILEDHTDEILKASEEQILLALEAIGVQAVAHAQTNITAAGAVDTGLLRNSITYMLGGKPASIDSYEGDRKSKYRKSAEKPKGSYSGTAPEDSKGRYTVYIGTNVEYAPYIEMGTVKNKVAKPFLRFALERNIEQYRQIFLKYLGGE